MDTKGICILVVNDDLTCINIVSEMLLQHCNYQVLHVGSVLDVLNAIWETKDNLDLVLTNAHKLESNGIVIVQHIQDKLKLPVILMCADKTKILSKGEPSRFAAYVLKGLSRSDVNNLWQYALKKEKDKIMAVQTNKTHASSGETAWFDRKRKTTETIKEKGEGGEGGEEDHPIAKKPRVVWTKEMHQKFLEAIEMIGYEKAVPKKIVEVMGISGLTRENVASHLQKFRGSTKRTQETGAKESITTTKSHYLQTLNNEISFGPTSGRTIYKNVGGYFPDLRNTLLETGENISSGNFVGYRLTNDGNTIEFGNSEGSNNKQDISIQPTAEKTGNYFSVQNLEAFSEIAQSFDDFLDEAMIEETGNKCCPLDWEGFDDALFEH